MLTIVEFGTRTKIEKNKIVLKSSILSKENALLKLPFISYARFYKRTHVFSSEIFNVCIILAQNSKDVEKESNEIYKQMLDIVKNSYLHRIWNFVPEINEKIAGVESYKRFNSGRKKALVEHYGTDYKSRICAATGIDIFTDKLACIFLYGKEKPEHLENPHQVSAYNYPQKYGKDAPSFARATRLKDAFFISGTASIRNHESKHVGDIVSQTHLMLDNIDVMLQQNKNVKLFSRMVVYVRHKESLGIVQSIVSKRYPGLKPVYLQANICRKELLVEAEMTLL